MAWRARLTSVAAWSDVAHNFRGDWQMLYREITVGFLLAGFIAQLGNGFFNGLFLSDRRGAAADALGALIGPIIAMLSFVCSVGNVPLAAVLWSGGITFAGVIAFIFADLIVLPIIVDLPQVLRHELRASHHRADVPDDRRRGAHHRRALQRRSG